MTINPAIVQEFMESQRAQVYMLLHTYFSRDQKFLLRSDLIDGFNEFCATGHGRVLVGSVLGEAIELIVCGKIAAFHQRSFALRREFDPQ